MGRGRRDGRIFKAASIATGAMVLAFAVVGYLNPDLVLQTRQTFERLGAWGMLLYVVVQTLWVLSTVPSIPLFVLAGLVFGPWLGALLALVGTTVGSLLTFLIGRHALAQHVDGWRRRSPQFDRALRYAERHEVAALLIARSAPVFPLNLLNYALGALRVSFVKYGVVSTLVSIPACLVYPALGEVLGAGALQVGPSPGWAWLLAVMIPGAAAAVGLAWLARRRYAEFLAGKRRRPRRRAGTDEGLSPEGHHGSALPQLGTPPQHARSPARGPNARSPNSAPSTSQRDDVKR